MKAAGAAPVWMCCPLLLHPMAVQRVGHLGSACFTPAPLLAVPRGFSTIDVKGMRLFRLSGPALGLPSGLPLTARVFQPPHLSPLHFPCLFSRPSALQLEGQIPDSSHDCTGANPDNAAILVGQRTWASHVSHQTLAHGHRHRFPCLSNPLKS